MNKKPITEISAEDLLKVLEDNKDIKAEPLEQHRHDIVEFISQFNLKSGEERINRKLLYEIYRSWSKVKISKKAFTLNMGLFLTTMRAPGGVDILFLLDLNHNQLLRKTAHYKKKKKIRIGKKLSRKHFENYLIKYSIEKGSFFIKSSVLYNIYDKWIYSFKKQNPFKITKFNNFFVLFGFESKFIDNHYWFGVDKSILQHLSKDNIIEMRKVGHAKKTK